MAKVALAVWLWVSFSIGVAQADAILEAFDSPNRIPNSYIISFSDLPELGLKSKDAAEALGESRTQINAHNKARVETLAREIASQYNGRVTALFWVLIPGFSGEFSEADILKLSKDPRIKRITANQTVSIN